MLLFDAILAIAIDLVMFPQISSPIAQDHKHARDGSKTSYGTKSCEPTFIALGT